MTHPTPSAAWFRERAQECSVVPLWREVPADWWTPVGAFHRLAAEEPHAFLLESVEGGERIGRYSFIGRRPFRIATVREGHLHWNDDESGTADPVGALREWFATNQMQPLPGLPPFLSGAVGYFGFDAVRWTERLPKGELRPAQEDDAVLLFFREGVAFDHVRRRLVLVVNTPVEETADPDEAYRLAHDRLDALQDELHAPFAPPRETGLGTDPSVEPTANQTRDEFEDRVRQAKEYIRAGDVFQVVLSQRFTLPTRSSDLDLYRSLRAVNPSPYMFLLRLPAWSAVGSSPEPLLRVEGKRLTYRPIAGTVPRSGDDHTDQIRAEAMREDPKERAEHVMLVDLGRNDLGRVAETGTVTVEQLMAVERYSHVMHLVSALSATLRRDVTPLDALLACLPAGTVSGAPKVRALEIIEELEPDRRGLYAGAVGYLDLSGNLDTCIALRTMIVRQGMVTVQAGAGIVADSDPAREFEETRHKARGLLEAVRQAGASS